MFIGPSLSAMQVGDPSFGGQEEVSEQACFPASNPPFVLQGEWQLTSAIHIAAYSGNVAQLKALLDGGECEVDETEQLGRTPLVSSGTPYVCTARTELE